MKLKYLLLPLICVIVLFSCQENKDYRDVIFITGTENSVSRLMTVDDQAPSEIAFSITSSAKLLQSTIVTVEDDLSLVDTYNKKYEKNYKPLTKGIYIIEKETPDQGETDPEILGLKSNQAVIRANTNISTQIKLKVTDASGFEEGTVYLLPVKIVNNSQGIEQLESVSTLYFIINKTIITQAVNLNNNYFTVDFASKGDESLKSLPAVTYETRVLINAFRTTSPFISSVMGLEENFLMRFGDTSIKPSQLQIAKPGIASVTEFGTNRWYHVAAVFQNGEVRVYVNGNMETTGNIAGISTMDLTKVYSDPSFMIGRSAKGRGLNGAVSEMRVWKKALSSADLKNNMCFVDPTTPGLVAYWRFNGADGKVVTDVTGNGYDATGNMAVQFIDNVRCPE